tara:strand:+ start:12325 stop:12561 length:237 start_codon:yes stop_codon:yes gene_type:complete
MGYINGYKYTTEAKAIEAVGLCNEYYLPSAVEGNTTTNWVEYQSAELNTPFFFYIPHHTSLTEVLGEPYEFNVKYNEI